MKTVVSVTDELFLVSHAVTASDETARLDQFLKSRYRKRSRESIQRAIEAGSITVVRTAGSHLPIGRLKPATPLVVGDQVLIQTPRKSEPSVNFDYRVLFEDEWMVVVDKPPNLPVHPAGRYYHNTLLIHLRTKGHTLPLDADREFFLAHRIDRETSGVLVLTKDGDSCAKITRQFAERKTEKVYWALVRGRTPDAFSCDRSVRKDGSSIVGLKMQACEPKPEGSIEADEGSAFTEFETMKRYFSPRYGMFSLVRCIPRTGRQHQIRVHLADLGHPIVGDKLYGIDENIVSRYLETRYLSAELEEKLILPRHALHAAELTIKHPVTRQDLTFKAELPRDLAEFIATLREMGQTSESATPTALGPSSGHRDSAPVSPAF